MKVRAMDLKPGQIIRIEYGDYDNWVNFVIDGIVSNGKHVDVQCHREGAGWENEFSWKGEALLEVVKCEADCQHNHYAEPGQGGYDKEE